MQNTKSSLIHRSYKKYLIWIVPIIAFSALMLLMKASGDNQASKPSVQIKKPLVNVMPIEWHKQYTQKRMVVGLVEAMQVAAVGFDLAGAVVNVFVDEGQSVKQGQVLAELDKQRQNAQMNELSALLERAQSEANLAELSLKRVTELVAKKLEPEQRLDETREGLVAAKAFVAEVVARQKTLQVEISKTSLRAPFDGSVVNQLIDEGTVINAGQALFNLQQNSQLEVRFALPTDYVRGLHAGQQVKLSAHGRQKLAEIKSIAQQRRLDTRTVDVIVSLGKQYDSILPGDLLTMDVSSQIETSGFWIPRKALVSGVRGLWSLFVVQPINNEQQLTAKLVELIYADDEHAYVRGALNADDQVVVDGVQRLVPKQKVEINDNFNIDSYINLGAR